MKKNKWIKKLREDTEEIPLRVWIAAAIVIVVIIWAVYSVVHKMEPISEPVISKNSEEVVNVSTECGFRPWDYTIMPKEYAIIDNLTNFSIYDVQLAYSDDTAFVYCSKLQEEAMERNKITPRKGCSIETLSGEFWSDPNLECYYEMRCTKGDFSYEEVYFNTEFRDFKWGNVTFDKNLVYYDGERLYNNNTYHLVSMDVEYYSCERRAVE